MLRRSECDIRHSCFGLLGLLLATALLASGAFLVRSNTFLLLLQSFLRAFPRTQTETLYIKPQSFRTSTNLPRKKSLPRSLPHASARVACCTLACGQKTAAQLRPAQTATLRAEPLSTGFLSPELLSARRKTHAS